MAKKRMDNITVEDMDIIFRNFSGKQSEFNQSGDRNFSIFIPDQLAKSMKIDGWNIKRLEPRDPEDEARFYLPVKVAFNNYPPTIYMISDGKRVQLTEAEIHILDTADIQHVDAIVSPYQYTYGKGSTARSGVKAYLRQMYVVLRPDPFAKKYTNAPPSGLQCVMDESGECI
jgi:hypothetical protein